MAYYWTCQRGDCPGNGTAPPWPCNVCGLCAPTDEIQSLREEMALLCESRTAALDTIAEWEVEIDALREENARLRGHMQNIKIYSAGPARGHPEGMVTLLAKIQIEARAALKREGE